MNQEILTTANEPEKPKVEGTVLSLKYWPALILRRETKLVTPEEFSTEELQNILNDMAVTMKHFKGVGLAANQVGIDKQIFVFHVGDQTGYMINPKFTGFDGIQNVKEECLSFPGLAVSTTRADRVTVEYQDVTGKEVEGIYEGLPAVCFQHEVEHLKGMSMVSTLSKLKRDIITKKMKKFVAKHKDVQNFRELIQREDNEPKE